MDRSALEQDEGLRSTTMIAAFHVLLEVSYLYLGESLRVFILFVYIQDILYETKCLSHA